LQQRLSDVKHPDHALITYPDLGHQLYSSSQHETQNGSIQQYVLADLYAWLEAVLHSYVNTTDASAIGANTSSSSKR
jgi:hypothetical protein